MDTALLDAAFRLVSHSIASIEARPDPPTTEPARLAELGRQFPRADAADLREALARAGQLGDVAVEMADAARGRPGGPLLDVRALAERCPGFSGETYGWAVNDGFTLTR